MNTRQTQHRTAGSNYIGGVFDGTSYIGTWYAATETRREHLLGLANTLADRAAWLMEIGAEQTEFQPFAEAADELMRMADFIEPAPHIEYVYWSCTDNSSDVHVATHGLPR